MPKPTGDDKLQKAINDVYESLSVENPGSNTYDKLVDQLTRLYALKEDNSKKSISKDALVGAGSSLLGILMIIGHERVNIVTSKALAFVPKLK